MKSNHTNISRRGFLGAGLGTIAAPLILPGTVLGLERQAAPSNRITLAAIGVGNRCRSNLQHFMNQPDIQCVAVCDSFADRQVAAKKMVDDRYGNSDCKTYRDAAEVLAREDIDLVLIGTGTRGHAVISSHAAKAGKDVYCEKPFSLTIGEGRAMGNSIKRYERVWQCGTQRRSNKSYAWVANAIQQGKIGNVHTVEAILGGGFTNNARAVIEDAPPVEVFDYDSWTGQAPLEPYSKARVSLWRSIWATGGGLITDMGAHYFDLAQWALECPLSGPTKYEVIRSVMPPKNAGLIGEVPYDFEVHAIYDDGVKIVAKKGDKGVRFIGDEGWIHVTDGGAITASQPSILGGRQPDKQSWTFMDAHIRNLIDCMHTRGPAVSNPEVAQRTHTICHIMNIAQRMGAKELQWNPAEETFVGSKADEANSYISRDMRAPWVIV